MTLTEIRYEIALATYLLTVTDSDFLSSVTGRVYGRRDITARQAEAVKKVNSSIVMRLPRALAMDACEVAAVFIDQVPSDLKVWS